MRFPCINADKTIVEYRTIDIKDVYFIVLEKPFKNSPKVPCFITPYGRYYNIGTLEGLKAVLEPYGFTPLDAVNVVNINKVKYAVKTSFYLRAYFEDEVYTSVSKSNEEKIKHLLKKADH